MKNKPIIFLLGLLFLLSAGAGCIGFLQNKKNNNQEIQKVEIKYEYYIEGNKVDKLPSNENKEYIFSRYECDNEISGNFDINSWSFTPNEEKNGTCKLYFVNAYYNVTLTAINGVVSEENVLKVEREADGQFIILPNEGYEFKEATCSNNKEAIYDISTSTLNVNVIMEDVACKVTFDIKNLKLDLVVKNGKGSTTEQANYGENISTIVEPNDGYEKPTVTCTNDQEYTYSNNNFSIPRITNNTKCTVTFKKIPIVTYKLILKDIDENVKITSGSKEQSIVSGKDGKFTLLPNDGYEVEVNCGDIQPSKVENDPTGSVTYTFLQMSKDITCNVKTKEKSQNTSGE